MRVDKYLVVNGFFESRNRALEAIKENRVLIDQKIAKASDKVREDSIITIKDSKFYVSRGAKKLESFLEDHFIDFLNKRVLDIGASSGGFTQIALEKGAKEVVAVDVGIDQLHYTLKENNKVLSFEGVDIRDFNGGLFDIILADLSFISLEFIIPHLDRFIKDNSDIILLFKPQFEVGKNVKRNKKGVVKDDRAINEALERFKDRLNKNNFLIVSYQKSKISGKSGNIEYFFHIRKRVDRK